MKKDRYFQWIDGEDKGKVVILRNIIYEDGEYFYNFTDGTSCNADFVGQMTNSPIGLRQKFMVEVYSPSDVWTFTVIDTKSVDLGEGRYEQAPPLGDILRANGQVCDITESDIGKTKLIPPKFKGPFPQLPTLDEYTETIKPVVVEPTEIQQETQSEIEPKDSQMETKSVTNVPNVTPQVVNNTRQIDISDPVYVLVKNSKKHNTNVDLHIDISLPAKAIFNLASSEFDGGADKFIDYVIDGLDVSSVIDSIKSALLLSYRSNDSE